MEFQIWYTALLLVLMSVMLVKEWFPVELTVFSTLLLLVVAKIITVKEAFAGFSNEGMLTIAFLFIVAGALDSSGMIRQLHPLIFGRRLSSPPRQLMRMLSPVSAVSAFINNTPVVAMLIPALRSWTDARQQSPSKYMLPLSYAAILGGMCTLIGTSTNLIVHGMMIDLGMPGLGMFEISVIGVPVAVLGILFISLIGHRLLPDRKEPLVEIGEQTRSFVIGLKVTDEYQNLGKTVEAAGLRHLKGLFLFQIERNGEIVAPARPTEKIMVGDRLFFTGIPKTILELQKTPGLQLLRDADFDLKQYDSAEIKTFECVVSPGSPLIGRTVRDSEFRKKYEAVIIAIHRHGERIQKKIGDIVFRPGDTLLILAGKDFREKWYHLNDFYLIAGAEAPPSKPHWQGYLALGVFCGIILTAVSGLLPLLPAAALGAAILLLTRCVSTNEARRMVDWRVLIIIAISLGIAGAVHKSGLAGALGEGLVSVGSLWGSLGVLAAVYLLTSFYATIISSNATAAILFPIAISAAGAIHASPRAFAVAVIMAAAASFATPISYQTNLMVYGPGGYKFKDFLRIGLPLQAIVAVAALLLIRQVYL